MNELIKLLDIDTNKPMGYIKIFALFAIIGFVASMVKDFI